MASRLLAPAQQPQLPSQAQSNDRAFLPCHRPDFPSETHQQLHKTLFACFLCCSPWIQCLLVCYLPASLASSANLPPHQLKEKKGMAIPTSLASRPPRVPKSVYLVSGTSVLQWFCRPLSTRQCLLGDAGEPPAPNPRQELKWREPGRPSQSPIACEQDCFVCHSGRLPCLPSNPQPPGDKAANDLAQGPNCRK